MMDNKEILEKNGGKRFDCVLMNPPYGTTGGQVTHLKFVDKCLELANKQVAIFPFGFVTKVNHKPSKKYKESFDRYLETVEEVSSTVFSSTKMPNTAIYVFDVDKKPNSKITIQRLDKNNNQEVNSLLDITEFTNYEKEIVKYLSEQGQQEIYWCQGNSVRKKWLIGLSDKQKEQLYKDNFEKNIKSIKEFYKKQNGASLIVNDTNGGMNGTFMSSQAGQIFDNYDDIEKFFKSRGPGYNVMMFKDKKSAENCKIALQHPLLRFTVYRTQNDQHMGINRVYKYIPAIDWSDDRVKTDEGLLEVCGCPKDKCHEYAEYCKKIIEEVDKK